jgi:ribulose-5-phosphate 4-epimerase/fuculose-1-phosphate aldolase
MTHGAIYEASLETNCVIHIHSRNIFDGMLLNNYPSTPKEAEYGTPEIAHAIKNCVENTGKAKGTIVLSGHDEGVIAYGPSVHAAMELILKLFSSFS